MVCSSTGRAGRTCCGREVSDVGPFSRGAGVAHFFPYSVLSSPRGGCAGALWFLGFRGRGGGRLDLAADTKGSGVLGMLSSSRTVKTSIRIGDGDVIESCWIGERPGWGIDEVVSDVLDLQGFQDVGAASDAGRFDAGFSSGFGEGDDAAVLKGREGLSWVLDRPLMDGQDLSTVGLAGVSSIGIGVIRFVEVGGMGAGEVVVTVEVGDFKGFGGGHTASVSGGSRVDSQPGLWWIFFHGGREVESVVVVQDGDDGWWAKVGPHILFCAGGEILQGVFPVADHVGQGVFGETDEGVLG